MKPEIVAELSCNHLGSLDRAMALVDDAAKAGADAVKLQVWHHDRMVLDKSYILPDGPWAGRNLAALYEDAETPWDWVPQIFNRARANRIEAFASVFDTAALAFLEDCGCPRYKIASFELVDTPLIEAVARTGKPMIISTGMATMGEIGYAVEAARQGGCTNLTLLKCTSAYPAPPSSIWLPGIDWLQGHFGCNVGLSDHTQGIGIAIAAVALGATMIEKHFTLSRSDGGPDAAFSAEPQELAQLVRECKAVAQALQVPDVQTSEDPQRRLRRSLYYARDINAGDTITAQDLCTARPMRGRYPYEIQSIIGTECKHNVTKNQPVS